MQPNMYIVLLQDIYSEALFELAEMKLNVIMKESVHQMNT